VLAIAAWPKVAATKRAEADRAHSAAKAEWHRALDRWKREASVDAFVEKLKALERAKAEFAELPNERRRRMAKLEGEREIRQRHRYLDRFRIEDARIRGIGESRTAMLASYGIETAADVEQSRIWQIPGFGVTLTAELLQWRQDHERNFRFNPNQPVDRRDVQELDRELETRHLTLLASLREGAGALTRLKHQITAARPRLMPTLEDKWTDLKIAEATVKSL
jgi:DNA-binding helix-hairpin-helix protein with protein kinase domain